MEYLELIAMPVIVAAVVGVLSLIKSALKDDSVVLKFFPLIGSGIGIILSIICYFVWPEIIIANSIAAAIKIGLASGLAATGTHQIFKQLLSKKQTDDTTKNVAVDENKENSATNNSEDKR